MNTLSKIIQSDRLKDQLAGAQKAADFGGKLARIVDFVLPGSGLMLNVATALVSGAAQAALAASGQVNGSSEPLDRDTYAAIYTATLHEAYLRAMVDALDEKDLGSVEVATVEGGLPSLADTAAELAYNRAQFGAFRQDQLFLLYERYLAQFLHLPNGDSEVESVHGKLEAVRLAAIQNFDTLISKDGAGNWVFRLELRQDVHEIKELEHRILNDTTHIKESVQRLTEASNNAFSTAGQEPTKNDRNTAEKNQVSNSRNFIIGNNATLIVNQNNAVGESDTKLTSALSLIEQMPTDTVPDIASIPSHSRFDFEPNPAFVGREDELIAMAKALKAGGALAVVPKLATTGMGGIGKSQLAIEFVHRYGQFFAGGVYWITMESADLVPAEVLACGDAMGLTAILKDLPEEKRVARVQKEWREAIPRLLVFDNCEDVRLYKKWVPVSGGSRVLVTSRMQAWARKGPLPCLPIATLPREKSLALLFGLAPRLIEAKEVADAIAEYLGDLPLALHLAGNYLATFSITQPADYLKELEAADTEGFHPSLEGEDADGSPTKHDLSVCWTFAVSYLKLEEADPVDAIAIKILGCAVWFAHSVPIPKWLLLHCVEKEGVVGRTQEKGLNRLLELGLLQSTSTKTVQLHRLIAAFAKQQMQDGFGWEWVVHTVIQEAEKVNNSGDPRGLTNWARHLIGITDQAINEQEQSAALLSSHLGLWLEMDGQYQGALPYYEQALAISQKVFGEAHPDTATSLNNLGSLLQTMGDLKGARPYHEQSLAIRRKALGEAHPDTANSLNSLGFLLQEMGDLKGARPYFEQALAIDQDVLGEAHPKTARSLNNLGFLLQAMGDLKRARPYYEQALAITLDVLGEAHPKTARCFNNLGSLLQAMGDLKGAQPYFVQALAIHQDVLGKAHPDTARSLNNLGAILDSLGGLEGARPYYEQAHVIRLQALGEAHPDTADSLNNLGSLLQTMGDLKGAQPYYEQALVIRLKVLGEAHPDTATSLNKLGTLLQAMGDLKGARPNYEQALVIRSQVLGEAHPDTATSLNNLGSLLQAMGDLKGARPYYEQALAIYQDVLGEAHPDTATSLNNLGTLLQAMGDPKGARPYYEQALAIEQDVLGEAHPGTARSLNNLGFLLQAMGDLKRARPYYEQALAITLDVLGEAHPKTARSLNNLGSLLQAMGDLKGAQPYFVQALAIHQDVLGEMHPDTARSLNNLGSLLQEVGDLKGAQPYFVQALAICQDVLGEMHPDTACSLNNLAMLLFEQGNLKDAFDHLGQAYNILSTGLGENHLQTLTVARNLNFIAVHIKDASR